MHSAQQGSGKVSTLVLHLKPNYDRANEDSLKDSVLICSDKNKMETHSDIILTLLSCNNKDDYVVFRISTSIPLEFLIDEKEFQVTHQKKYDNKYTEYFIKLSSNQKLLVKNESFEFSVTPNTLHSHLSAKVVFQAVFEVYFIRLSIAESNQSMHHEFVDRLNK